MHFVCHVGANYVVGFFGVADDDDEGGGDGGVGHGRGVGRVGRKGGGESHACNVRRRS